MKQSTLLVINTAATYVRMVLSAVISLVIVRLLYRSFGLDGYGLFVALTASSTLLMVVQNSLVAGAQRQIAYELGRSPTERVIAVYNATLMLFSVSALAVLAVGLAMTEPVLRVLTIPSGQETAARWTFWLSLMNLCGNIAATPVRSVMQARQSIVALSAVDLFDRIGRLVAVFLLPLFPGSPLATYMGLNVVVTLLTFVGSLVFCRGSYPECRFAPRSVHRADFFSIGGFSGWLIFEQFATSLREQGSVVALNSFFGPAVNVACDIALRLGNQMTTVASGLGNVITPALTTREGGGDALAVERLGNVGGRYFIYASSLLFVPILLETATALDLWLGSVPPDAIAFVQITLVTRFLGILSWGDAIVARAKGRIGRLSIWMTAPFFPAFSIACVWFYFGGREPLVLPIMMLVVTGVASLWYRPWLVRRMQDLSWTTFLRGVLLRTGSALLPAALAAAAAQYFLAPGAVRLIMVTVVYWATLLVAVWCWGIEAWERSLLWRMATSLFTRVQAKLSGAKESSHPAS